MTSTGFSAPTRLRGVVDDVAWGAILAEVTETVPDLWWPTSTTTYAQMRRDPQIQAILAAHTLPIRRATWTVNPAGCNPNVAQRVADDLGLPVAGQDTPGAARVRGVSWSEHLRMALQSLTYGHAAFELEAEIRDGQARLTGMYERLQGTINTIHADKQGRLVGISQDSRADWKTPQIPADRLVFYSHEREGAAWQGTSLIRACYAAWLVKREMIRVHATSNRRFGAGVPVVRALPGTVATPQQETKAQQMASSIRVGEQGGASLPPGFVLDLVGLTGTAPDTLAFMKWLDQQMSGSVLARWMDLGDTSNGSRALGEQFIETFMLSLQSIADEHASTVTRDVAARIVGWNEGDTEPVPAVQVADVGATHEVTAEALKMLLDSGALTTDPGLEAHVRRQFKLPERQDMPQPAPSVQGDTVAAANRPNRARGSRRKEPARGQLTLPLAAAAVGDGEQLQQDWDQARTDLLEQWPDESADLTGELAAAVAALVAADMLADLGQVAVSAVTVAALTGFLVAAMTPLAASAAALAAVEVAVLGLPTPEPGDVADRVEALAAAHAGQVAAGYAQAAGRKALTVGAADVEATVREHLDAMSDAQSGLVADVFGAALTAAQNTGRAAVLSQLTGAVFVADESGDAKNRCTPCSEVAGTEYATWAEAEAAYPISGFAGCAGGPRCRGRIRPELP
jgi:hypothetical protein